MSERLHIKKEEIAGDSISCPGCGNPLAVGAVICVECGYDTRTRRRVTEARWRKPSPIVILGLVLVALVSAAAIFLKSLNESARPTPTEALPATSAEPPPLEPTPAETPISEADALAEAASPSSEITPAEPPAEATARDSAPTSAPPEPKVDWSELTVRQRERLRAEADRRSPMFEPGESVEVRLANGMIRRGIFRGLDGGALRLEGEENESIPLERLDRNSRLRADVVYRERYIEYLTRQRIAELQRAHERAVNASPGGG